MAKNKYDNYSKEQLIAKLNLLEKKRYGLIWEDKPEYTADQCERELPVWVEEKNQEIIAWYLWKGKYPNKLLTKLVINDDTNKNKVSFENKFTWTQAKLDDELKNNTSMNLSKSLVISNKKQNYSEEVLPNLIDESVGVTTTKEAGKRMFEMFGKKYLITLSRFY